MKLLYALIIIIFFQSCSFDNKTGIWKNDNYNTKVDNDLFEDFQTLSSTNENFNKIIPLDKNFKFISLNPINNSEWKDIFYDQTNNLKNFKYNNLNQLKFKSKKLSKYELNKSILFEEKNLIVSNQKGDIIIYSINNNTIITKFNFYKKKFKKIKKVINFIVDNNIIYISDNIGYLYALDYKKNKIIWAKNYKIPFRSNLKLFNDMLIASDQNNNLSFFNKNTGEVLKIIPTEETTVKNLFVNNLSLNEKSLFFLNTYGSLYSIDLESRRINWFINLNQSLDLNPSNLFFGNQIINNGDKIVVTSNQFTYVINTNTGSIIYKMNISTQIKPLILNDYLFLIAKNNLIISMDLSTGKILFSYDVNEQISKFLNIKKEKVEFKNIFVANNKIYIILKNSYILNFNINGNLENINKLPSKINSQPIFIDSSLMYLDFKKKLSIVD
jgi:outer membrane protein assembly factor BamB